MFLIVFIININLEGKFLLFLRVNFSLFFLLVSLTKLGDSVDTEMFVLALSVSFFFCIANKVSNVANP